MKDKKIYIAIIIVLVLAVIGMGVKIALLNRDLSNEKNMVQSLENIVTKYKEEIKERCPEQFNFVD